FRRLKQITLHGKYVKRELLASASKLLSNLEDIKISLASNDEEELAKPFNASKI
ncbi:9442_t:CDS:1, partial [Paraglomus occultum]